MSEIKTSDIILKIEHLTKKFENVTAIDDLSLDIKRGEIHGIIGANGSGKSTLMNVLFGNFKIKESGGYSGNIYIEGKKIGDNNSENAISLGMGMIHQEFALMEEMTISENIKLTKEKTKFNKILNHNFQYINSKENNIDAQKTFEKLGMKLDTDIKVGQLSTSMKQFVEIAREIDESKLKILVLDEPTAVLNIEDSNKLLEILEKLRDKGVTILFISHRLEEIQSICDRITILKNGTHVGTYLSENLSLVEMAEKMMGHEIIEIVKTKNNTKEEIILELENFSVDMPGEMIKELSLKVKKSEILGLISLSGHGKLALGHGILGRYKSSGQIKYKGKKLDTKSPKKTIGKGIYFLSDDRKNHGLLMENSIKQNIQFTGYMVKNKGIKKGSWLKRVDKSIEENTAKEYSKHFDIKCENISQNVKELSGGNQQKVCLARSLYLEPELLIIAEPTRGIDIAAKEKILKLLVDANEKNDTTLIIASSELQELRRICDRIAVLCEGKLIDILIATASEKDFGLAISGDVSYKNIKIEDLNKNKNKNIENIQNSNHTKNSKQNKKSQKDITEDKLDEII